MKESFTQKFSEHKTKELYNFTLSKGYSHLEAVAMIEHILFCDRHGIHVNSDILVIRLAWSLIKCGFTFTNGYMFMEQPDIDFYTTVYSAIDLLSCRIVNYDWSV